MPRAPRFLLLATAGVAATLAYAVAACAPAPEHVEATSAAATALPTRLPQVDAGAILTHLSMDETLEVLNFEASGATTVNGEVNGYRSKVWAVPVAAGQTLTVTLEPADANLRVNVMDAADVRGELVHRGEVDGQSASITAAHDTTYLIQPLRPRAATRAANSSTYALNVSRS